MLLLEQYRPFLSEHLLRDQQNAQDDSGQSTDHQEWGSPGKSPITGKWFAFVCPCAHSLTKVHLSCRIWSEIYFIHKIPGEWGDRKGTLYPSPSSNYWGPRASSIKNLVSKIPKWLGSVCNFSSSALESNL